MIGDKTTRRVTDQTGASLTVSSRPRRIVSLVPSQTELLFDLGLDEEIIAVTDFCTRPAGPLKDRTRVGGPLSVDCARIEALVPDLIIANKEENDEGQVARLRRCCPVWVSDIATLENCLAMIDAVGSLVGKPDAAREIVADIRRGMEGMEPLGIGAAYCIWDGPLMVAGAGTFISDMMRRCGLENVFADCPRYPVVTDDDLRRRNPSVVLLSSEPYPFDEASRAAFAARFPAQEILLVDGEMFCWYGSRVRLAAAFFRELRAEIMSRCADSRPGAPA